MNNQIVPQTVVFNNQELITFEQNGIQYTAMKPICENIGIDWASQFKRIERDEVLNSTMVITTMVAEDGNYRATQFGYAEKTLNFKNNICVKNVNAVICKKVLQNTSTNSVTHPQTSSVDFLCLLLPVMGKMNLSVKTVAWSVCHVLNILSTPFKGKNQTGVLANV